MGITEEFRANNEALTFNDEVRSLIFMEMGKQSANICIFLKIKLWRLY